jgi:hypothetical protein
LGGEGERKVVEVVRRGECPSYASTRGLFVVGPIIEAKPALGRFEFLVLCLVAQILSLNSCLFHVHTNTLITVPDFRSPDQREANLRGQMESRGVVSVDSL